MPVRPLGRFRLCLASRCGHFNLPPLRGVRADGRAGFKTRPCRSGASLTFDGIWMVNSTRASRTAFSRRAHERDKFGWPTSLGPALTYYNIKAFLRFCFNRLGSLSEY